MPDPRIDAAITLMNGFAQRTGLTSKQQPRRYLWTDAFAVCNFLGLADTTGEQRYTELALNLVEQVHHTLGRHRDDDPRKGWISGLNNDEAESHPTRGGLRIGKSLNERGAGEPFDERLEWERDGQYFHYLTKWMHALDQVSRSITDPRFNLWARELAATAHGAFTYRYGTTRTPQMYWKMSIDLTRPLVPSMGQQDPLDGYVTAVQLEATATVLPHPVGGLELGNIIHRYATMVERTDWTSADPLGIGGLLVNACLITQLISQGAPVDEHLVERLLNAALSGLKYYAVTVELQAPAEYRLAFRELGLAIGLQAVEHMRQRANHGTEVRAQLEALMRYMQLGDEIESFWRDPVHQGANTWSEHRDINEVMLATRLAPGGFLVLASPK